MISSFTLLAATCFAAGQYSINEKSVGVQLFQWPFKSIEQECEFLAAKGYGWVQTSPVAPHPSDCGDGQKYPWYLAYQPLAYKVGNRLGTEQDFKDMVATCRSFDIDIIVDVVLNHNAYVNLQGDSGFGITQPWSTFAFKENMGDLGFNSTHYHDSKCNENVSYISDQNQFDCRAGNLVDIATENQYVRESIAGFLNMMLSYGVIGFRTDLATYIPFADWSAIKSLLSKNYKNQDAFFAQEAYPLPSTSTYQNYPELGRIMSVSDSAYTNQVGRAFMNINGRSTDQLQSIIDSQPIPSEKAMVFIENHDQERNEDGQRYYPLSRINNGWNYKQAMAFNILYPFGIAQVHSGYKFSWRGGTDATREVPISAPYDSNGYIIPLAITNGNCPDAWFCQHRWTDILQLVKVREFIGKAPQVSKIQSNGPSSSQIWWSIPQKAFVAINSAQGNQNKDMTNIVSTGLPAGVYCNMLLAQVQNGKCQVLPGITLNNQETISYTVDAQGNVKLNIKDADRTRVVALYIGSDGYIGGVPATPGNVTSQVTFAINHRLAPRQNMLGVVGSFNNWNTCNPIWCRGGSDKWTCGPTLLPVGQRVEWKAIESAGNCKEVIWTPGSNQVVTPSDLMSQTVTFSY